MSRIAAALPLPVPAAAFPQPPGAVVRDSSGVPYTVVVREGVVWLACCAAHEADGSACGWYPDQGSVGGLTVGEVYECSHDHGVASRV